MELARSVWNLLENKYLMSMFELGLPSIQTNHKIYIPVLDTVLTKDNIMNLPELHYSKRKKNNNKAFAQERLKQLNGEVEAQFEKVIDPPLLNKPQFAVFNNEKYVMCRVLCNKDLPINFKKEITNNAYYQDFDQQFNKNPSFMDRFNKKQKERN